MEEAIHVTMHIVSRKKAEALKADRHIHTHANEALKALMHPIESGEELAKRLSLPANVPIKWNVEIAALHDGFHTHEDHIPIMISVAGVPNLMERLRPEVMEEVTNIIFKEIRHKQAQSSKELATALGYHTDKPTKFHLYLPHQVRVRGPARPDAAQGDGDGDGDGGPPVWAQGGWSKGCSSWPW
jgi:hypothetical protein